MYLRFTATAALVVCLGVAVAHSVQAQRQYDYQTANPFRTQNPFRNARQHGYQTAGQRQLEKHYRPVRQHLPVVEYASAERQGESTAAYNTVETNSVVTSESDQYETFELNQCDDCSAGDCCGDCLCCESGCFDDGCSGGCEIGKSVLGGGMLSRPGQFFLSADYIYARTNFSEALAYIRRDTSGIGTEEFVMYDFDYKSSYRIDGGYRFCDCGGEIRFNFSRYRGDSNFVAVDDSTNVAIFAPYEVEISDAETGTIEGLASVDVDSYDLGYSKTIPFGGSDCDCCDPCSGCCDAWCPVWDLTWSAGLRFANVEWLHGSQSIHDGTTSTDESAFTALSFEGAGARVGLLGRRYFGRQGFFSVYAKGDLSLLAGQIDVQTININDATNAGLTTTNGRIIVPVTEIEAGATAHLGNHIQASAGYFLSAWHDLGIRDEYDFTRFQVSHYDDANILGFDGFFARAEISY